MESPAELPPDASGLFYHPAGDTSWRQTSRDVTFEKQQEAKTCIDFREN